MASIQTTRQHDKRQGFHSDTVAMPALNARHRVPLRQLETTRLTKTNTSDVDADALAAELRRHVHGEVRFDSGSRALYTTDGSNYRQVPIGVVIPRDIDDIIATVATARRYGAPVLARGGGTSLAGQCCNVAVVLDMSKYLHHILAIDPEGKRAQVQPGVVLDDLRNAAEQYHLTFGPDPSTHNHCTLGGMIGNNSCGVHSVMAGKTEDNVEELDVLTYDGVRLRVGQTSAAELERIITAGGRRGEIYARLKALRDKYADVIRQRYPDIPRRVSGYNLPQLLPENGFHVARALVGSEGTCVTVLEATVRLVESPPVRSLLVLGYPDVYTAGDHIIEVLAHRPIGLEGLDDVLVDDMRKKGLHPQDIQLLPEGGGWLLVEFGGQSKAEADDQAHRLMAALQKQPNLPTMKLVAVFRDDLGNLFPNDEDARRLSQHVYLLSEFLAHEVEDYQPPHLHRQAIVHGQCHHKAIMGMDAEAQVLSKLGLDYHVLDSGCCGMAGSFGFEAGHYNVSLTIGEHELLPAVRQVEKDTLIIADGFSCREQIAQTTDRQALHLAQVLQMALHDGPSGPAGDYPETPYLRQVDVPQSPSRLTAAALVGVGLLAGGLVLWEWRQARRY